MREAVDAGAEEIVAQGGEAGGHRAAATHAGVRSRRLPRENGARYAAGGAGGVADGRSLAAALLLGADGVLIGSRLVELEALTPSGFRDAITPLTAMRPSRQA